MKEYIIPFENKKVLEIGGGQRALFHPNIDIRGGDGVEIECNLEQFPLPIKNEEYEGIYSAYTIEHITWRNIKSFIKEIYRVLKPNGTAVFLTSDLLAQAKSIIEEGVNQDSIERIFGSQEFPEHAGCHKTGFDKKYASKLFEEQGFKVEIAENPMPDIRYKNTIIYPSSKTDLLLVVKKTATKVESVTKKVGKKKQCSNLGSFTVMIPSNEDEDWINVDMHDLSEYAKQNNFRFIKHDLKNGIPDNDLDLINCSHLIEHFDIDEGKIFLNNCFESLVFGGIIRVGTPDLDILIDKYKNNKLSDFTKIQPEGYADFSEAEKFFRLIVSAPCGCLGSPQYEGHKTVFNFEALKKMLEDAGFINIKKVEYMKETDMFPELSMYVIAQKPKGIKVDGEEIKFVEKKVDGLVVETI